MEVAADTEAKMIFFGQQQEAKWQKKNGHLSIVIENNC